jgi:hypothetical protein
VTSPFLPLKWHPSFRGVCCHTSLVVRTLLLYLYMSSLSAFPA